MVSDSMRARTEKFCGVSGSRVSLIWEPTRTSFSDQKPFFPTVLLYTLIFERHQIDKIPTYDMEQVPKKEK
jgi:hypothetical protein